MICNHAESGCNYLESECAGLCFPSNSPDSFLILKIIAAISSTEQHADTDGRVAVVTAPDWV